MCRGNCTFAATQIFPVSDSLYAQRGVSAQKEEVHAAIKKLDKGLYAHAFCKMYPDYLGGNPDWVNISHADGAGTRSILAYLWWKETGDASRIMYKAVEGRLLTGKKRVFDLTAGRPLLW